MWHPGSRWIRNALAVEQTHSQLHTQLNTIDSRSASRRRLTRLSCPTLDWALLSYWELQVAPKLGADRSAPKVSRECTLGSDQHDRLKDPPNRPPLDRAGLDVGRQANSPLDLAEPTRLEYTQVLPYEAQRSQVPFSVTKAAKVLSPRKRGGAKWPLGSNARHPPYALAKSRPY